MKKVFEYAVWVLVGAGVGTVALWIASLPLEKVK